MESIKNRKTDGYVYDISLDGSVVNALGLCLCCNTDGFNFQEPNTFEYTDEHPYISNGKGRNSIKGKSYTEIEADVAEFEDIFFTDKSAKYLNRMGLGIDDILESSCNYARKNYSDLFPDGKIKMVGNSIKSKKMPVYIEKFINENVKLILTNKGYEFITNYYSYIDKIYNLKIPLREIASKGKIKKSIEDYKKDCNTLTAAGSKKSRQAWYELIIKDGRKVDLGETVYFINIGKKKGHSDVKRVTHYRTLDNETNEMKEINKELDKQWSAYRKKCKEDGNEIEFKNKLEYAKTIYPNPITEEDEILFNCVLLDNDLIEAEGDTFCDDEIEYNVEMYIDKFNKRIKPLLVCFSPDVRDKILINKPSDKPYIDKNDCELVSGYPMKPTDQDTYEQLMTMEDKEIRFWMSIDEKPPFVDEIGMDWEEIKKDYIKRMDKLKEEGIRQEKEKYNEIIEKLTSVDLDKFLSDGKLPKSLSSFLEVRVTDNSIISSKYGVKIGDMHDLIDKKFIDKNFLDKGEVEYERASSSFVRDPEADKKMDNLADNITIDDKDDSEETSEDSEEE